MLAEAKRFIRKSAVIAATSLALAGCSEKPLTPEVIVNKALPNILETGLVGYINSEIDALYVVFDSNSNEPFSPKGYLAFNGFLSQEGDKRIVSNSGTIFYCSLEDPYEGNLRVEVESGKVKLMIGDPTIIKDLFRDDEDGLNRQHNSEDRNGTYIVTVIEPDDLDYSFNDLFNDCFDGDVDTSRIVPFA